MRNNMENLVGRKVKCVTNGYCNFDLHQDYIIINESETMYVVQDKFGEYKDFPKHKFKYYFELLPNEPQFKQGDKVLWSGVKSKDKIGIFICEYENYFIVKLIGDEYGLENGKLKYAEKIRPYEDEIKVGDWVKRINDETIWKIRNKDDINVALNSEFTKITDEVLINKLNEL